MTTDSPVSPAAPAVLAVGGLDPSGGAGILRDAAELEAAGCRALAVATSLTVQDGRTFRRHQPVDPALLAEQLDLLAEGPPLAAVKLGMLATGAVVDAVTAFLARTRPSIVVLDPVLGASAGGTLLDDEGVDRLLGELLPFVTVLTPNLPELQRLFHLDAAALPGDALAMALEMLRLGLPCDLVVKGGHRPAPDTGTDLVVTPEGVTVFPPTEALRGTAHGTGCTFASALTGALARGLELPDAVRYAKARVEGWIVRTGATGDAAL